jgi:hypothetical protein
MVNRYLSQKSLYYSLSCSVLYLIRKYKNRYTLTLSARDSAKSRREKNERPSIFQGEFNSNKFYDKNRLASDIYGE